MFKKSMFITFSVGGISSPIKFAVAMSDTSALKGALMTCMGTFAPVAYLEILDELEVNPNAAPPVSTVFPGYTWTARVFAVDMYGKPAQKRPICLRTYELDWHDYFADRVKLHDDYLLLKRQQQREPWATLENFTYFNTTCWLTNTQGIANVRLFWDHQEVKFRQGAFAYYFESVEFEDGAIYSKFGTRWFTDADNSWLGKIKERACLASFGFHVPDARTDSYYAYIRQAWAKSPAAVYSTGIWPHPEMVSVSPQGMLDSDSPQHGSHYGSTDRRMVTAGVYTQLYLRLYQGTADADFGQDSDGVYPKDITMTSYIISGPPNFPKSLRRCYDEDANDAIDCWHSIDMVLTAQARSDDYGYGSFSFMATDKYLGVFTIVIAVGHSQSGIFSGPGPQSNEFSQTFEIEVVPFRALTSCNNVNSIIAAQTPALAPFLKYYNQCPARNPDGSCVWEAVLCPTTAKILVLKDGFLGDPLPACIPLGTVFPSSVTATVQNDMGQPISGHSLHLSGGAQSASLALHPSVSAASDAAGLAVTNKVVLDYAEPGLHTLQFRLKLDGSPFEAASVESQTFRVTDQVVATFVQQPPASLVMGRVIAPTIQVQLRIKRKCFSNVVAGAGHHTWNPPVMVLHASLVQVGPASNNFTRNRTLAQKWDARSSIVMSGAEVTPTFTPENMFYGIATANFTALQIESGMQGLYQLHVSVKGSTAVLANSLHFELQRFARRLHLLDPVPKYPNSDNTLILRVRADSNSGDPVSSDFILAKIEVREKQNGQMLIYEYICICPSYMYILVRTSMYIDICINIYICIHTYLCICMYMHIYIYMYVHIHMCIHIHIYIFMHTQIYVHTYIYICI